MPPAGIRHSVSGADYGTVRAAAFMGLALCSRREGNQPGSSAPPQPGTSTSADGQLHGLCHQHLCPSFRFRDAMLCCCMGLSRRSLFGLVGNLLLQVHWQMRVQERVILWAMSDWRGVQCTGGKYLCAMTASHFQDAHEQALPDSLTGSDFLAAGNLHVDSATSVLPTTRS